MTPVWDNRGMNIIDLFYSFRTQEEALEYLEKARWHGEPACLYCGSVAVCQHASPDRANRRWQCQDCHCAFSVTVGTIFHRTHVPLKNWFLVLALMLNAKKSASAYQIARDLGMRRATVWSMMHRIRVAMKNSVEQADLLHGIVEADETYIGGKPRRKNRRGNDESAPRGRATRKTPVIGMVERGGRVVAQPQGDLTAKGITKFVRRYFDPAGSLLITDEYKGYQSVGREVRRAVINHSQQYVDGITHTNTIEGFWALVKRAWYGSHHHYSNAYLPLYIGEACYKYNARRTPGADTFQSAIAAMVHP